MLDSIFRKIDNKETLSRDDLISLLSIEKPEELKKLFSKAYEAKLKNTGNQAYIRGLIEYSNICPRDCYYCGIRKSNKKHQRYSLSNKEVLTQIEYSYNNNYSSVVIQAGERQDKKFIDDITDILQETEKLSNGTIRVTLSLGEQSRDTYQAWYNAGAHRYLLRIETSNQALYNRIHPETYSFENRVNCLKVMKQIGYQLGTGVLIGFPGQTIPNLADDIIFYKEIGADMIGMGPYIPHIDTPMGKNISCNFDAAAKEKQLTLGLKMIAVTRLFIPTLNIASTTALETLSQTGLEQGLLAGANVFMINLNEYSLKKSYMLYDNKPCFKSDIIEFQTTLEKRLGKIGEKIAYGEHGDAKHYQKQN